MCKNWDATFSHHLSDLDYEKKYKMELLRVQEYGYDFSENHNINWNEKNFRGRCL